MVTSGYETTLPTVLSNYQLKDVFNAYELILPMLAK